MANTKGGVILVGVEEEEKGNEPKLPLIGVNYDRGLSERVTSICLSNIAPPVFPEIGLCTNDDETRAIIVIRVPESHETPHAVGKNTKVYIRTGDVNTPEKLATIEYIGWLQNRRAESIKLRNRLYSKSETRFLAFYNNFLGHKPGQGGSRARKSVPACVSLTLCSVYPKQMFRMPPELRNIKEKITSRNYDHRGFPDFSRTIPTMVQDGGVLFDMMDDGSRIRYAEFNSYGLYAYKDKVLRLVSLGGDKSKSVFPILLIIRNIDEYLTTAGKYYKEIGYFGSLEFTFKMNNTNEYELRTYEPGCIPTYEFSSCPDEEISNSKIVTVAQLSENKDDIVLGKL